ncbi:uncharacterized protein A4U43_C04F1870 [Asparagus officinalis]|uniref:Proton gradient regulation 5 n=1 Tax=Asparagus officinalis TaxID=4686 RepID=A0A5P1F2Z5_ASPOF|nr:protein PROTON GRADIENT REGULATION 5, chloroplastic-like [Asparagus officinalis]ONK70820.1 uncharacterized protein A4U43_C04F1870 [Asparagus officinalis]
MWQICGPHNYRWKKLSRGHEPNQYTPLEFTSTVHIHRTNLCGSSFLFSPKLEAIINHINTTNSLLTLKTNIVQTHTIVSQNKRKSNSSQILSMAASLGLSSAFTGNWASSFCGDERRAVVLKPVSVRAAKPVRSSPRMGNVNEGKGLFAPVVVVARNVIGKKRFNQIRGKAIALHSQVINEFCKSVGADGKQRQGLIRLAKKNGEKLGFLA